ncbi:hypothetical protein X975_01402, partial [Stegodyphus mimosarum]
MVYLTEEDLCSYDKLKTIVLKEFQPTPQECLNSFQTAQKLHSESYVQFASRLSATFEYYCQLRKVSDFKSLCELIVSDKIFGSLDRELMTHIAIKQGESYLKPQQLGRECDIYLTSKGKGKSEYNLYTKPSNGNESKRHEGHKQQKFQNSRFQRKGSNVFLSEEKSVKCNLCKNNETHTLNSCPQFKKLSVPERVEVVKINKVCFKCLSPKCSARNCTARDCFCGKPHNKLIHFSRQNKNKPDLRTPSNVLELQTASGNQIGENAFPPLSMQNSDINKSVVASNFERANAKNVLLSTVRTMIKNQSSQWEEVRCILDSGSQTCLLSQQCVNRLGLKSEKINTLISCLNDSSMVVKGRVTTTIANKNRSFEKEINFLVVKKITDLIPHQVLNVNIEVSDLVPLADLSFNIPGKIDMLLGAEIFYELLRPGQIYAQNSKLLLQNTVFGYVASGSVDQVNETKIHCGFIQEEDLNKTLKNFWEIESVDLELIKGKENSICEEHFVRTHWRNEEGRYVVTMPLKDDPSCLGHSRDIALKKLRSLWTRLSRDSNYLSLYRDFIHEYIELGHMKEVKEEKEPEVTYYATHHAVYKPEKTSTKLRVVFNCSSLTTNGISLNSLQYNGGVIQQDLFSIMIGFRIHVYALTADVKKMYRMILIDESQHNLQRILWSDSANETPKTYELVTVTYGTVSAPFLAMRTLKQLSLDEESNFPMAAPVLRENFYMDDVLCGAATLKEAKELQRQLIAILQRAGMHMHKWCANHSELSLNREEYNFSDPVETKTLGVSWKPIKDCFSFRVKVELSAAYTKRCVLSSIARIFDPLGLLGSVIAKAKIFMQKLWRLKIDWSDRLPSEENQEWHQFLVTLESINNIDIDGRIVVDQAKTVEIHGFADASERCFGAAVYCKSSDSSGRTLVRLITSKSRVAPLKSLTIPRLELCAAVLLTKLVKKVLTALKLAVTHVYYWSDSMIVLAWIQREPVDLKTFVQHRVATIQSLSSAQQWHHVTSDQNPADLLSRGVDPDKLVHHKLWWCGPAFLVDSDYPIRTVTISDKGEEFSAELKTSSHKDSKDILPVLNVTVNNFLHSLLKLSNNYITILRVVSYIFRFVNNLKKPLERLSGPISVQEMVKAELFLIRETQNECFSDDIHQLLRHGTVLHKSKLKNLNPFLDSDSVLRVGGRLGKANLTYFAKHPAILPKGHKFTLLVIQHYHKKYLHVAASALLSHTREKFWPLNGRSICRKVVHDCIVCFKNKPVVCKQIMGNLPSDRIVPDYPFNCSGVDFCDPFFIRYRNQRKGILHKMYVCIFVCFVSKAVHIEKGNIHIGDLVLLIEDNVPTHKWVVGRIIDVYYGDDKKIWVVKIKTKADIAVTLYLHSKVVKLSIPGKELWAIYGKCQPGFRAMEKQLRELMAVFAAFKEEMKDSVKEERKAVTEEMKALKEEMKADPEEMKAGLDSVKEEKKASQEKMEAGHVSVKEEIKASQEEMERERTCIIENKFEVIEDRIDAVENKVGQIEERVSSVKE